MKCRYCRSDAPEGASFCPSCGKQLDSEEMAVYRAEDISKRLTLLAPIAAIAAILIIAMVAYEGFLKPKFGDRLDIKLPFGKVETAEAEQDQNPEEAAQGSEQESPKAMYVNDEEGLILRKGPGTENDIIHIMSYGDEILVEKIENDWAYGSIGDYTGWCSAKYLTEDKSSIKPMNAD